MRDEGDAGLIMNRESIRRPIHVKQVNQIDLQYLEIINVPSFHNDLIIDFLNKNCKVNINELFHASLSI